jgi:hypothetical protein
LVLQEPELISYFYGTLEVFPSDCELKLPFQLEDVVANLQNLFEVVYDNLQAFVVLISEGFVSFSLHVD